MSAPIAVTTDTDEVWRRSTSTPSAPTGGTSSETHTPSGWTRSKPSPTTTQAVYKATRTLTYNGGVFSSATAWGSVTLVTARLTAPLTAPGVPTDFRVTSRGQNYLDVAWTVGTGGAPATFRIRISTNSTVSNADPYKTVTGTSARITALSTDTNYWLDIDARNSVGTSDDSTNVATSTTAAPVADRTDTDEVWRRSTSTPSTPTGGTSSETHTPSGWTRSKPSPTTTQAVYKATRTRTYTGGVFSSATAWGNVTLVDSKVSTTTVVADAGDDASVNSLTNIRLGGSAVVTNGIGATTYSWSRISGTGGLLSATATATPFFVTPTIAAGSANRDFIFELTATNNGVSGTDRITITVVAPVSATSFDISATDSSVTKSTIIYASFAAQNILIPGAFMDDDTDTRLTAVAVGSGGSFIMNLGFSGEDSFIAAVENGITITVTSGTNTLSFTGFGSDTTEPYQISGSQAGRDFFAAVSVGDSLTVRIQYP